ncbi:DUF397 domain-containing protein [Actinacidiphila oryziradicis]|uniref:DUF397 domain-containing protein n=1 Tax=Actinacidiphila oryziradicis TaxID=2571141 RepID=A0A4U0RTU0_9ACTN|nr:DUF397 domain-containing protein [Actinacidiphila oryziradicis]TJZ99535.1 DUF397 domain-containing protein [Actinacidiphila oryziradicis]
MTILNWQKSSHSQEASACVYLATAPDGTIRLRESDDPDAIVTAAPTTLRTFLRGIKAGEFEELA